MHFVSPFIPAVLNHAILGEVIAMSDEEAADTGERYLTTKLFVQTREGTT